MPDIFWKSQKTVKMNYVRPIGQKRSPKMTDETYEAPRPELLPCPFCGREAEVVYDREHQVEFFSLGCPQGPCPAFHIFYMEPISEIGDAVMWWNRRAYED